VLFLVGNEAGGLRSKLIPLHRRPQSGGRHHVKRSPEPLGKVYSLFQSSGGRWYQTQNVAGTEHRGKQL